MKGRRLYSLFSYLPVNSKNHYMEALTMYNNSYIRRHIMAKFIQRMVDHGTYEGDKVPKLTRVLFPWSGIFRDACYQLVGTFLTQCSIRVRLLAPNMAL